MKITSFTKPTLRLIADDFKEALKPLTEKYGVSFTYKGCRFDENTATFKVEGAIVSSDGIVSSKERQEFIQCHSLLGLPKEVLDQNVNYAGEVFTVIGLKLRSHKFPVLVKRVSDGKGFKLKAESVIQAWKGRAVS